MKVGVPVVPGTPGPVEKFEDGWSFVEEHGYPGLSPCSALYSLLLCLPFLTFQFSYHQGRHGRWRTWYACR